MFTDVFEDYAQSFRVVYEAYYKHRGLFIIDPPESIGNIEAAIKNNMDTFHSLYDYLKDCEENSEVNWYDIPEIATILVLRNAKHHNLANKIRLVERYHQQNELSPVEEHEYFMVSFNAVEEGGHFFPYYISWNDINELLSLSRKQSEKNRQKIREYLNADEFERAAIDQGFGLADIMIDYCPLMVNSGVAIYPFVKDKIETNSTEAGFFARHFSEGRKTDTSVHLFEKINSRFPV